MRVIRCERGVSGPIGGVAEGSCDGSQGCGFYIFTQNGMKLVSCGGVIHLAGGA